MELKTVSVYSTVFCHCFNIITACYFGTVDAVNLYPGK